MASRIPAATQKLLLFNDMQISPHVSIVVPVFNLEKYIEETLQSIVQQTFRDWEVLVVDDGSTDNTSVLVGKWAKRDDRIKLIRNQRSKGVSGARNTGIDHAQGQWIAFLDGDDLFKEDALEARVQASGNYPDCSMVSGDFIKFSVDGDLHGSPFSETNAYWRESLHGKAHLQTAPRLIFEPINYFLVACLTWTGCVMIRTNVIKELAGFNEKLMSAEDDHLWLRVAASVDQMLFVPNSISFYRQRENSSTHSDKPLHRHAVAAYQDLLRNPLFSGFSKALLVSIKEFSHSNTFFYRSRGKKILAVSSAIRALRWDFFSSLSWRNLIASILLR